MIHAVPLSVLAANAFVAKYHRHHQPVVQAKFCVGAVRDSVLIGVVIVERPKARMLDNGDRVEVTRMCTNGSPQTCSFLYSRAARIAREMGFSEVVTYILDREPGTSLKASGWTRDQVVSAGGSWSRPSRPTVDRHQLNPKQRWSRALNDPIGARAIERASLPQPEVHPKLF